MSIEDFLAKSTGVKLITHNRNVAIVSEHIAKKLLVSPTKEEIETIRVTGLLHDIGKMTEDFQDLLKTKKVRRNSKNKFLHNEIGWAFLTKYFNTEHLRISSEYVNNMIYWHHGIYNKLNSTYSQTIIDSLSEEDVNLMKNILVELLGEDSLLTEDKTREEDKSPLFYRDSVNCSEYNRFFSINRTCLISADRIVSQLEDDYLKENKVQLIITKENISEILNNVLDEKINKTVSYSITKPIEYDEERYDNQKLISESCSDDTTIIKAPAGYGKTLVGLLWSSLNNKKTIWVVPRNEIAYSIYDSIIEELNTLNLGHVKVELFLTGTIKDRNYNVREDSDYSNENGFISDIIITNIDNFEAPSVKDNIADRLFITHSANIVFDEFHEFVSDLPFFACFINLMRIRHQDTNSKTILLSATPIDISYMWDGGSKTLMLPNNENHYSAIHDRKYKIRVVDEFIHDIKGSELIVFNSVFEAQYHMSITKDAVLYHSYFNEEDRKNLFSYVQKEYGKNSIKNLDKKTLISTLIVQASLNISVRALYDSLMSPEASLQRIGRLGRFSVKYDYDSDLTYTLFKVKNRKNETKFSGNERFVVNEIYYDDKLSELWYEEMLKYNNKELTLDEIYDIYNEHVKKNSNARKTFFSTKYRQSLSSLINVYPKKIVYKDSIEKISLTAGSNKLRSVGNEIFFIVNEYDLIKGEVINNKYVGPFTANIYKNIEKDFDENINKIKTKLIKSMKFIDKIKDERFDYSKILKNPNKIPLEDIRGYGRKSNSPYIRFDMVYVPNYGLVKWIKLNELGLI